MSPHSRRALLATIATGTVGSVSGCTAWVDGRTTQPEPARRLANRSLYVAADVTVPTVDGLARSPNPTDADIAVFPAGAKDVVLAALDTGTVAAVVGTDAQATLMAACAADGRSYGFARNSWNPDSSVVAAVPGESRIDTHLFVGLVLPDDLPWALGEVVATDSPGCSFRQGASNSPDQFAGQLEPLGTSRIRGLNDAGGFDRWDRVRAATGRDGSDRAYVIEIMGTIYARSAARRGSDYVADQVRLVADTDGAVTDVDLGTGGVPAEELRIDDRTDRSEGELELRATPQSDAARRSFTACQQAVVVTETARSPFDYLANGRFRWRNPGLLDDELWHHHTPGRAVWYPR
jgi:hypothetical protein